MSKQMITYKILVLGDSTVGKTAYIVRFCEGKFDSESIATIGVDSKTKFVSRQDKKIQLMIWDTAGQERFRSLSKSFYKGAHGIILMYDISNMESFKHIKNWINDVKNNVSMEKLAVLVVGNKSDLPENEKKVLKEDREKFENEQKIKIIEVSAKEDKNINESMVNLIDKLLELGVGKIKNEEEEDEEENSRKLSIKTTNEKKKDCCAGGSKKKK